MAAQIFSAIFAIIVGVGGCVAYFWGANKLLDLIFPSRGVAGAAAIDNLRRQGLIRPWLFVGPALIILTVYLIYPVIETLWLSFHRPRRREFRRPRQLSLGVRRPRVPQVDLQQHPLAGRRAGRLHLPRPGHRRADRPHLVGHDRQEPDLHAAGHLLRRRQRHLEVHLRISRRGPDPDRPPQRHRPVFRRQAAGLDLAALLEQFLPDGHPDLDPDRLCHGHPVVGAARHSGRDASRRPSSTAPTRSRSSGRSWCRRSGAPSPSSGPPSPSWC